MTDTPGPGGSIFRRVLGLIGGILGMIGIFVFVFRQNVPLGGTLFLAALVLEALAYQGRAGPMGRNRP